MQASNAPQEERREEGSQRKATNGYDPRDTKKKHDVQEKVEPPAARVANDVGTEAAVEPTPALGSVYVTQGEPDAASNTALGSARRHLKFDLEEVERVHAEHGCRACADACECMVLQGKRRQRRRRRRCPNHKRQSVS